MVIVAVMVAFCTVMPSVVLAQAASPAIIPIPGGDEVYVVDPPGYARISSVSYSVDAQGNATVSHQAEEPIIDFGDALLVITYLDNNHVIVACHGSAYIPNLCFAGGAALIDLDTMTVVEYGSYSVSGNTMTIDVTSSSLVSTNYLESHTSFAESDAIASYGPRVLIEMFADTYGVSINSEMRVFAPVYQDDDDFIGVPGGARAPAPAGMPPTGDITGDGNDDWDFDSDTIIPNSDIIVDVWTSDNKPDTPGNHEDSIIFVIGHDTNGNGKLDVGEQTHIIGECVFPGGRNQGWIKKEGDGVWYAHWVNVHPITGEKFHYIYNTQTGILKIYNEDGVLVYIGPPEGWDGWWHD